jgi:hypothetical protein
MMTRRHTLHAPTAGIRLAVTTATTIVIDPGPDEIARTRNLARERSLIASALVLSVAGLVMLRASEPHDRPWTVATGLLLGALACGAVRPGRRTVPTGLVDLLEPLRTTVPTRPGEIHRLVWEAANLLAAAGCAEAPCPDCVRRVKQIHARLRVLIVPAGPAPSHALALLGGISTPVLTRTVPGHAQATVTTPWARTARR